MIPISYRDAKIYRGLGYRIETPDKGRRWFAMTEYEYKYGYEWHQMYEVKDVSISEIDKNGKIIVTGGVMNIKTPEGRKQYERWLIAVNMKKLPTSKYLDMRCNSYPLPSFMPVVAMLPICGFFSILNGGIPVAIILLITSVIWSVMKNVDNLKH